MTDLNEAQQKAVETTEGPLLILAGAGSGKTKTITARLAYLLEVVGIPSSQTLTLTFTNKAAKEMRHRAMGLLSHDHAYPPLLCTFHKFGLLFLKFHIHLLGRSNTFVVIDTDDKKLVGVQSLARTNHVVPPAYGIRLISVNTSHMVRGVQCVANQHCVRLVRVERAVGLIRQRVVRQHSTALQRQRRVKVHALRCGNE